MTSQPPLGKGFGGTHRKTRNNPPYGQVKVPLESAKEGLHSSRGIIFLDQYLNTLFGTAQLLYTVVLIIKLLVFLRDFNLKSGETFLKQKIKNLNQMRMGNQLEIGLQSLFIIKRS